MRAGLIIAILLTALFAGAEIVPSLWRINWDPGVRGGITNRTTIHALLDTNATASTIQSALNAAPAHTVVLLTNGTFTIDSQIRIPSSVTLRGLGLSNTIIKGSGVFSGVSMIRFESASGFDDTWSATARDIVNPVKGSQSITTAVAHGWSAGDVILIDALEQPNGDPVVDNQGSLGTCNWCGRSTGTRPWGQWVKIVSVPTSTTATIDPPLYWSYTNAPQGLRMSVLIHYAGLEDLTVDNLTSGADYTVAVEGAINSWITKCMLRGNYQRAVWFYGGLWFSFTGNYVIGGVPIGTDKDATEATSAYKSQRAYGFFAGPHCTAAQITDNIFEKLTLPISWEGCSAGNVFAYNFVTNIWWYNTGDSPRRFGPLMHGPHPFMNLHEGNWSGGRIRADEYWGTSSHFVNLRNRVVQIDRGASDAQTWTVDIERRNWYWTFLGNQLGGVAGVNEDNYELINGEAAPYSSSISTIWKIGYESLGSDGTLYDATTLNTMIRWGNWSYRTNDSMAGSGIVWHTNNVVDTADTAIPNSFYLSSKPDYFGFLPWPPYGPAAPYSGDHTNIPAGYRYAFGTNPPAGGGGGGATNSTQARIGAGKIAPARHQPN